MLPAYIFSIFSKFLHKKPLFLIIFYITLLANTNAPYGKFSVSSAPCKMISKKGGKPIDYKRPGKRIREERRRLNLTQAQLAEAIDISDTYMGAIERGERSLTLDTLVRLVNRLGVTVDYMLADSVTDNDSNIIEQFKQIIDNQPLERKQMAVNVLRTIFAYFDKNN